MKSNLKDHKFILFVVDHYNPLGMARSLGEEGILPIVILHSDHPTLFNHCKYVQKLHQVSTIQEGYDLLLHEYGEEQFKPFVLTANDDITMFLDLHYNELIDKFYFFNGGKQGAISHYMNKENICNVAEECGIDKPRGEVLTRGEMPKMLRYPVLTKVIKSTEGAWKDDVFICRDESELKKAYKIIKANQLLVQEYIIKKNELCVDGISINEGAEIWAPFTSEYIRFTSKGYGHYMWIKPYADEVKNKIQNILKKTHYSGIFSLECLIDENDHLFFLEVNFRNSTWSYAYTFAGLNLPYQWAKATLEGHIDYNSVQVRTQPFTAMNEMGDLREGVLTKQVGFFKWMKQLKKCDVLYLYNKKDKAPFYYGVLGKVLNRLHL
ncbi:MULTISPECIES: ATP-grasp domain-containing protein [Bacteroides]|jgi:D-aspartate ligase|uniref:ATP-grasp domain-containing protein n=1 Tax=Bacteroides TaxID=816 RepID=UPI000E4F6409|nr:MULTISPECIES: ATP-grasp domain-containing protein [Bacteroides]RHL06017.1 ATP-grasp domain-containing protein [Bacteroides sp. AF39-11AC]